MNFVHAKRSYVASETKPINDSHPQPIISVEKCDAPISIPIKYLRDTSTKDVPSITPMPPPTTQTWPTLTIKNLNTSFKVISDLTSEAKIKIVDDCCLAIDDAYLTSLARYISGQSRSKMISFLEHMLAETKIISRNLLHEVRTTCNHRVGNNTEVNTKIAELQNLHYNFNGFLHRFDIVKNVYKTDSQAYAAMGSLYDEFDTYNNNFFRELVLGEKH